MKIGLIDVDGHNFPNLPLMKLAAYHRRRGDEVEFWQPLFRYDVVYKSKVFTFTPDMAYMPMADAIYYGGTGYKPPGLLERQRDKEIQHAYISELPPEVERITPDYSLYPQYSEAYGFLTRGCPRNCSFCIVTQKEGCASKRVADLREFWTGQKTIKLLDPNLLACMERERVLKQLADSGAWVDFTQGLDIRLIDKDVIELLNRVKVKIHHFAWDNPAEDLTPQFTFFAEHTNIKDHRRRGVYVLTNFTSTHAEDLARVYTLRDLGFDPYVMIFDKETAPQETRYLQRWVNNKRIFKTVRTFKEYDNKRG